MGRTKQKRKLKKKCSVTSSYQEFLINLQIWLAKNHWKNDTKLKIKPFIQTGRGITSKISMSPKDVLISMPANLMITFRSIKIDFPIKEKLAIQELLALYLITEKIKERDSSWYEYINSLPEDLPPLPWLATEQEINLFPAYLCLLTEKAANNFKKFLEKINRILKFANCTIQESLCKWAYVMVNTRAVYINPDLISDGSSRDLLLDNPSMALCPFLDMFNHHFTAKTEAHLLQKEGKLIFQLRTLTGFKKNKQIFISYGQHDNIKLLMEYGFFIPGNIYDTIKFEFEDILKVLKFKLDQQRYKFIKEHRFHEDLYLGYDGVSYNLKRVLFIGSYKEYKQYKHLASIVFGGNYTEFFLENELPKFVETLLYFKKNVFQKELLILDESEKVSDSAKTVVEFVKYLIRFVDELKGACTLL